MLIKTIKEGSIEDLFQEIKEQYDSVEFRFHSSFEDFVEDLLEAVRNQHIWASECKMESEEAYDDYQFYTIYLNKLYVISNKLRFKEGEAK